LHKNCAELSEQEIATFLHIKNVGDKLLQNKFISNASSLYKHRYTICTTVDCCVHVNFLQRNIHLELDIDICSRKISFVVEKLKQDLSVFNYTLGMWRIFFFNNNLYFKKILVQVSSILQRKSDGRSGNVMLIKSKHSEMK
jgi:hypothetical protein